MHKKGTELVMGIDIGTGGVRAAVFDLNGACISFYDAPLRYTTPHAGWAEQSPDDWWTALCTASRNCLAEGGIAPDRIIGIGADTTSCTIVLLDRHMQVVRPAVMWMDIRASSQARRIMETGHSALKYNGYGSVSAEYLPCKALWLKENEPDNYTGARHVLECIDWLMYRLTGNITGSINTASVRGYFDDKCGGWPVDFFERIGLDDLIGKLPGDIFKLGDTAGKLTEHAAAEMGLIAGIPVGEGGIDGHVAMVGLNVLKPGRVAMITGSSHTHLALSENQLHSAGILGSYPNAVIPGYELVEGGQISTGSVVNWFRRNFCSPEDNELSKKADTLARLDDEASGLPIGSDGLIALDYFQGNRTPHTDSDTRGMIYGLTLKHDKVHIYRAIIEGICYGTGQIMDKFRSLGLPADSICVCGGATRSRFWLQIHADVCNVPIMIPKNREAPALGSAILAAVAGGAFASVPEAAAQMVEYIDRIEPDAAAHEEYMFYFSKYTRLYPLLKDWMHGLARHEEAKGSR